MAKKPSASDALMSQLKKTMKPEDEKVKISVKPSQKPSEARKTSATPPKKVSKPKVTESTPKVGKVSNQNVSLYPESRDQIFEIQSLIRKQIGAKCSDSRAVQIALKICPLENADKILKAFSELQAYDGRTSRHKK